ncbi:hypothetical protein [Thermoflexibacter ruber]|uniref:Uncharacterized protein n=1 Tax=Thermoflexibacter ruber TaxID=1003 RepID=A0A1I2FCY0_9BACT|nr:hypothetical protein [Thermoflexibacter ruber]SFF02410.1 hypothetical protein SAMN04488541_101334 [Thermoflexibacter ruber]
MRYFLETLKSRNETLFIFGLVCLLASLLFFYLTKTTQTQVMGVNAWFKPFKFALSIAIYAWTIAWFVAYLPASFNARLFNWSVVVLLGFELIYIALQAGRGQLSHYNVSSPLYSFLYFLMALAATIVTLWTAYIGILFFLYQFPELPAYYLWAIRIGIIFFVIFSLEGFVMGSRMTHTIGGADGGQGLPLLNWNTKYGDPRVAHFIGMHALQVLPLLSYYLLRNVKLTFIVGLFYGLLAFFTLWQALQGKPFYKF